MNLKGYFRGFVAISISKEVRENIEQFQKLLIKNAFKCRWVGPQNIHITLKFLGNVEDSLTQEIHRSLLAGLKDFERFRAGVFGTGVFPNIKRPSVFFANLKGGRDNLLRLYEIVESCLTPSGFQRETREFKPHLTIGRFKERVDQNALERAMEMGKRPFGDFTVGGVSLYKSELSPKGPVYSEVSRIDLK